MTSSSDDIHDSHDAVESLSPSIGNRNDEQKREIIIISDDEESFEYDGRIMTVETTNFITKCSKQVPHFEEQTTQKNTTRWIRRSMEDSRHDLSIMKSNDEKASQRDCGIMTAEVTNPITDGRKQMTASDQVSHFEEQTTQKNTTRWIRRLMEDSRHDLSIMKSNDEKSSQCDGGIMTAETTNPITDVCKQATATDEVPHFEEQTTRMITKDVSDARQKESMCTHVSMKASRHDQSEKSSQCVGGIVISETANFVNECGKQVTASDKIQYFEEQMNTKDADVAQQKESRLDDDVTLIGPSSLSHAMEVIKGNKRIGFMGSSCRFRHTNTTNIGDIQNKTQKSDEGVSEGTKSIVTYSSEIKPISHKETPVTNYSFNYADNSPFMRFPHNQVSYARKVEEFVLRSRASSFEWEPTKAFRSNFLISQGVFVPDIRFDPNHNRIESLPKIGERQNVDGATQGNIHKLTQEVSIHKPEFVTVGDTNKGSKPQRDSKPLQCFQAALVESVKGFLKSAWRDGKLSRDAHKQIVKKTVEKVIATLPSNEIPEIKEYLTTSETKLMKLVEGYTAKYGKI